MSTTGPSSTRALSDTGPKLFYVEDPWGQYSLRGGADIWTEQLPRLLREAHAGHQYVVTSRTDMLDQARADQGLKRLDGRAGTRINIAMVNSQTSTTNASSCWRRICKPRRWISGQTLWTRSKRHSKSICFSPTWPTARNRVRSTLPSSAAFLRWRHREAVEGVVVSYLTASDETGASAIVWALLAARSQFDRNQLVSLNRQLRTVDPTFIDGLEKLVKPARRHASFAPAWARPSASHIQAFGRASRHLVKENWGRSEAALMALISALTQLGGSQREWALETAAQSLKAITRSHLRH